MKQSHNFKKNDIVFVKSLELCGRVADVDGQHLYVDLNRPELSEPISIEAHECRKATPAEIQFPAHKTHDTNDQGR